MKAADREFLTAEAKVANGWMTEHAFPVWRQFGFMSNRGFADELDFESGRNVSGRMRLRVLTRQIYVFCRASQLGFQPGFQVVKEGLHLLERAKVHTGGYASELDHSGVPLNESIDTYDLAFVLFALGHAYSLLGETTIRVAAQELLHFLRRDLGHPCGGFVEGRPSKLPRRQNPHMHLLEASLVWLRLEDGNAFRKLADDLVALHTSRFIDENTGAVIEYFDDELRFLALPGRGEIEPGHLYEWYWLLRSYSHLTGHPTPTADACYQFARKHGQHSGYLAGELCKNGAISTRSVRLWPHAEWARAEMVRAVETGDLDCTELRAALSATWSFLQTPVRGLWHEHFDGDSLSFRSSNVPASSLYHIVGAFSALTQLANTGLPF